ncbi:MAG TPA: glutaminase [Saprospiraceae bacterium]|nr:glutaminase [Saprospiraceae bacterium]
MAFLCRMDYQSIIDELHRTVKAGVNEGAIADYIPELGNVDVNRFGVSMMTQGGGHYCAGDWEVPFSMQSCAKVLSLALAYKLLDGELWKRVDVEPSGTPFNSLLQLESNNGIPRNPFVNAGAIVVCDVLVSLFKNPKADLLDFIHSLSGNKTISYDRAIAESERKTGFRNKALVNFIRSFGNIYNDCEKVLDLYFNLCSIKMTCQEACETYFFLANGGRTREGKQIISSSQTKRVNAIMQTCGFYDEAGEFAYRVGLPGKSGVGGGIVALYPSEYVITVWSPLLNKKGNSYRGMKFLEAFTTRTASSIF